jgi:hypothetical protein
VALFPKKWRAVMPSALRSRLTGTATADVGARELLREAAAEIRRLRRQVETLKGAVLGLRPHVRAGQGGVVYLRATEWKRFLERCTLLPVPALRKGRWAAAPGSPLIVEVSMPNVCARNAP